MKINLSPMARRDVRANAHAALSGGEKEAEFAQKLGQLQPFIAVFDMIAWASLHLLGQPDAFRAGGATAVGGVLAWCGVHGGDVGYQSSTWSRHCSLSVRPNCQKSKIHAMLKHPILDSPARMANRQIRRPCEGRLSRTSVPRQFDTCQTWVL
jgi:hypothetical protein